MSKPSYRIIFNQARGLLMTVAETAHGQGKASGKTTASSSSNLPLAVIRLLTCFAWGLLVMAMTPVAYAQIVADPTAPGNQRPTVLAAPNNVPLVNLQTPSAA